MNPIQSVAALNGAVFLFMFGVGMIVAMLPAKMLALSDSAIHVGAMASAFAIPYILFQLPIGRLSDRYGCKTFLAGGYGICAVAGIIFYASSSSQTILWGRMVQGIGEAPVWALGPALLSILYPGKKARAMGWYNASLHLGLMAGSLTGVLMSRTWSGSQAFLLFSALSTAAAVWIAIGVDEKRSSGTAIKAIGRLSDLHTLLKRKTIVVVFSGILLYGVGYGLFLTIVPAFLIQTKGAGTDAVGTFFTLFYVAISLAQLIIGPLADRFGRMGPMVGGMLAAAIGMVCFPHLPLPTALMVLACAGGGLGVYLVASLAFLNDQVPSHFKGTVSGAFYLFWGCGFFAGPMLIGAAGDSGRYNEGFFIIGLLFALVSLTLFTNVLVRSKKSERL